MESAAEGCEFKASLSEMTKVRYRKEKGTVQDHSGLAWRVRLTSRSILAMEKHSNVYQFSMGAVLT